MTSTASLNSLKKSLSIADHLLFTTYPVVKDPKILLSVLAQVNDVYVQILDLILPLTVVGKERSKPSTFAVKFDRCKHYLKKNDKLCEEDFSSMQIIHDLVTLHRESAVEFIKKDKLVICSDNYSIKKITKTLLEKHVRQAKKIVKKLFDEGV